MKQRLEIPWGIYCYDKRGVCPYWGKDPNHLEQENGFCSLLDLKDWGPDGDLLLWDQIKCCSFNDFHDHCDEVAMPEKQTIVAVCQINVIPKRPDLNVQKMREFITAAHGAGAHIAAFSEMVIPGYLIGDDWEDTAFIEECIDLGSEIEAFARNLGICLVYGNVASYTYPTQHDGRALKHNAARLAAPKFDTRQHNKINLPNYREFDDRRHFTQGNPEYTAWVESDLAMYTVSICEDGWDNDYAHSPISDARDKVAKLDLPTEVNNIHFNLSCSPFTQGKNGARNRRFAQHSEGFDVLFYVNNVGVQNNGKNVFVFDGSSTVYAKGRCVLALPPLVECLGLVGITKDDVVPVGGVWLTQQVDPALSQVLTYAVKEFCAQSNIQRVVIGLSGGIDSAVSAMLHVSALGADNVTLVNMPTQFNSNTTKDIAKSIATNLGCRYLVADCGRLVDNLSDEIKGTLYRGDFPREMYNEDSENIQARMRGMGIQAALAGGLRAVFPNNGNKAETLVGYCTMGGDHAGYLAPIGDLWKHEVYAVARELNAQFNDSILPQDIFTVVPSAELSANHAVEQGKGDPIVYWYHDKLFASWIEPWNRNNIEDTLIAFANGELLNVLGLKDREEEFCALFPTNADFIADIERWWGLFKGLGTVKRVQAPPTVVVSRRAFGFDFREAIGQVYYTRKYKELKDKLLA